MNKLMGEILHKSLQLCNLLHASRVMKLWHRNMMVNYKDYLGN